MEINHVIVPLDGSDDALRALFVATQLAQRLDAEVTALAVATMESHRAALWYHLEDAVGAGVARLLVADASDPAAAIVATTRRPHQLVCMASHGRGRSAALVGSVAARVVAGSAAPVVLVGPHVASDHLVAGRFVACVDGRHDATADVDTACAWAQVLALQPTVITVAEPVPEAVTPGAPYRRMHGPDRDADEYIGAILTAASERNVLLDGDAVYDPVSVTDGVRTYVRDHQTGLLSVSSRADSGLSRLFTGSTAAAIVRHVPAPVLVLRPEPRGERRTHRVEQDAFGEV